jgi:gamma-glutamyltranspeptidase/glutathione hydrolase
MKRAFADRAHWLGDPDCVAVPRGLIDKSYARELAGQIDMDRVTPATPGQPPDAGSRLFEAASESRHTTHIAAADAEGNWVAITATVNTTFGSKVVIPGTGVVMNDEMDDFAIAPGTPNAFGLIGAEANAVAPGKRPLSSMSPTIVLEGGRPILTLGAAGGPKIISQVLLVLVRRLDLGQSLESAVAAPRLHHQWSPDLLYVEKNFRDSATAQLPGGYLIETMSGAGVCQAIGLSDDGKSFVGVSDPRVGGKALGR